MLNLFLMEINTYKILKRYVNYYVERSLLNKYRKLK